MKILYVSSEAFPFCKTGGLADVAGSLPSALARNGDQVAVILPLYGQIGQQWRQQMTFRRYIYVDLGWRHQYCGLFSLEKDGVTWYFVDNEHYFCRGALYGEYDDGERFAFFCKAVIDLLPSLDWMPDILHCNDWQTALVPIYLKDVCTRWEAVRRIRTVFTIHNIEYQGRYGADTVDQLFGLDRGWYNDGTLQMDGDVNLMKGAMLVSDAVTTVSPTYAAQLHDAAYAEGMEGVVRMIDGKFSGVVNGLDVAGYDPAHDPALPENYGVDHMAGKAACKASLQASLGLAQEPDTPLMGIVSRLVGHKGLDIVEQGLDGIMATGCQLVVLGKGESRYEDFFRGKAWEYGGRLSAQITYAARNSDFDGFAINEGDYLALCDGKLMGTDRNLDVLLERLARMASDKGAEFITIYAGEGVSDEDAARAAALFETVCPQAEVSALPGGQPVYYYIVAIE